MSNVYRPRYCYECKALGYHRCKALYIRVPKKGFVRIGWKFECGHVNLDKVEEPYG